MNIYVVHAAAIAAIGSLILAVLTSIINEREKKKHKVWELRLARCDEQIGKLYAPLMNLVEQLDTTDDLKTQMVGQDPPNAIHISKLIYDNHFKVIHEKIAEILETKLHLLEGEQIPKSFYDYYAHVASEKVVFNIQNILKIARSDGNIPDDHAPLSAQTIPYPEPFFKDDIARGFNRVLIRQERLLTLISNSDVYDRRFEIFKRRVKRKMTQYGKSVDWSRSRISAFVRQANN